MTDNYIYCHRYDSISIGDQKITLLFFKIIDYLVISNYRVCLKWYSTPQNFRSTKNSYQRNDSEFAVFLNKKKIQIVFFFLFRATFRYIVLFWICIFLISIKMNFNFGFLMSKKWGKFWSAFCQAQNPEITRCDIDDVNYCVNSTNIHSII